MLDVGQLHAAPLDLFAERQGDGMFAALLQGSGDAQHFVLVQASELLDAGHRRAAFGERTRLVEHHVGEAVRLFQRGDVLHQDAGAGRRAGAGHDGGGRRQAQGARAGDDKRCGGADDGGFQARTGRQPGAEEGDDGDADDRRHEDGAHAVDQPLHGWLADLRVLHQMDHLGERGVLADRSGLDVDEAVDVDGASRDRIAWAFGDGIALAGDEGFVHVGLAAHDLAVGGDAVAWAAGDHIADHEFAARAFLDAAVRQAHQRGVRLQIQQFLNGRRGAALGSRFEVLAEHHQGDDDRRRLEIEMRLVAERQQLVEAVEERGAGAQGHQHVHVGAASAQRVNGAAVEAQPEAELQRQRQHQFEPRRHVQVHRPFAAEHERHLHHERRGQERREQNVAPFARGLPVLPLGLPAAAAFQHQPMADVAHCFHQRRIGNHE